MSRILAAITARALVVARDEGEPGLPVLGHLHTRIYSGRSVQHATEAEAQAAFFAAVAHDLRRYDVSPDCVVTEVVQCSGIFVHPEWQTEELGVTRSEQEVAAIAYCRAVGFLDDPHADEAIASCLLWHSCLKSDGFTPHVSDVVTCGIDPGSSHVGLAVTSPKGELLHKCTLEVGHEEHLAKVREVKRSNGKSHFITRKRAIDADDLVNLLAKVREILERFDVQRIVLEWVEHVRAFRGGAVAGGVGTHIARAQWVGGAIAGMGLEMGLDVRYVTARSWVALVTKSNQKGRRGVVADAVEARYPELKGASNEHERDAVGLCLYDRLKTAPPLPPPPRAPKADKVPRALPKRKRVGQTEEQARRAAAGCTCGTPRHKKNCKLYEQKVYRKKGWL